MANRRSPQTPSRARRPRRSELGLLVVGAGYAGLVSATTPFTIAADVAVAVPLFVMAVVIAYQVVRARRSAETATRSERDKPTLGWAPWAALLMALIAWELYSYLAAPRAAHPTLSSLYDSLARWQAAKAAVCLCWLALGWYLVRLPLRRRP